MLDIFVLSSTLLICLIGFSYGLVRLSLWLSGWIGAALLTFFSFDKIRPMFEDLIESRLLADLAAACSIFVGSLIVFTIINQAISSKVRVSSLSFLDRSLGLLAGFLLSALLSIIGFIGLVWATNPSLEPGKEPEWIKNSKTFPLLDWGSREVFLLLPEHLKKNFGFLHSEKTRLDDSFEKLVVPKTKIIKKQKKYGYTDAERREMDRLIQGQNK